MKYNKIAIISDIHANMDSLNTFLEYVKEEKIDLVLNLGDFISNGPQPCEVFDSVMSNKQFINIKGYDEESLCSVSKEAGEVERWQDLKSDLGEKRLKKLKELPRLKELVIEKKRILIMHNNGISLMNQRAAHEVGVDANAYDYIFCGGSHRQELIHNKEPFFRKKIIDPGPLGCTKENKNYFVVMNWDRGNIDIAFKTLEVRKYSEAKEQTLKEIFLHIYEEKRNKKGERLVHPEIIEAVLELAIRRSSYICVGCWDYEKKLIKELLWHLKCRGFKKSISSGQEWYIGEVTQEVKKLLLEKNRDDFQKFKWLELSFQDTLEDKTPTYSIYHYGSECYLRKMSSDEVYEIEELLKKHKISYTIDYNPEVTHYNSSSQITYT